jgi:hypothetical protein
VPTSHPGGKILVIDDDITTHRTQRQDLRMPCGPNWQEGFRAVRLLAALSQRAGELEGPANSKRIVSEI